jgi:hypothetical protein
MRRNRNALKNELVDRNVYEEMSFKRTFQSGTWKRHLEETRTRIPISIVSSASPDSSTGHSDVVLFAPEVDTDEELITSRFQDYLRESDDAPNWACTSAVGLVLREFLNSFGPLEASFWRSLPFATLVRVVEGRSRISIGLSEQLSKAFGTRSGFWSDLQRKYDRWETGSFDSADLD